MTRHTAELQKLQTGDNKLTDCGKRVYLKVQRALGQEQGEKTAGKGESLGEVTETPRSALERVTKPTKRC